MAKKIIARAIAVLLMLPALAVFNENVTTIHYNFIALAYCVLMVKYGERILPIRWVKKNL